jgi:hypothetical protein
MAGARLRVALSKSAKVAIAKKQSMGELSCLVLFRARQWCAPTETDEAQHAARLQGEFGLGTKIK